MYQKLLSIDYQWLLALNHFANSNKFWQEVFKLFGVYAVYLIPIVLIVVWFWSVKSQKVALGAAFSGVFSWVVFAKILAAIVRRPRPFDTGGFQELLFKRPDFSFPSDHATLLFAVAFYFWLSGYKKLAYFLFAMAILGSMARIGIGVHFPGDVISGAVLGLLGAWIVWLLERPLNYFYNFLIAMAKKLRLA